MIDWDRTVVSQFSNSPIICSIIETFNECVDPTEDFNNFLEWVWNVDTAQGFGLDILGRIVAISRFLAVPTTERYFGFMEIYTPFNDAPFFTGATATDTFELSDEIYRRLIIAKAYANIMPTTAQNLNNLLKMMFPGRGAAYVEDLGGMAMNYTFTFALEPWEEAMVKTSGAFPHPAGVLVTVVTP
jgi:hypothetical protein